MSWLFEKVEQKGSFFFFSNRISWRIDLVSDNNRIFVREKLIYIWYCLTPCFFSVWDDSRSIEFWTANIDRELNEISFPLSSFSKYLYYVFQQRFSSPSFTLLLSSNYSNSLAKNKSHSCNWNSERFVESDKALNKRQRRKSVKNNPKYSLPSFSSWLCVWGEGSDRNEVKRGWRKQRKKGIVRTGVYRWIRVILSATSFALACSL